MKQFVETVKMGVGGFFRKKAVKLPDGEVSVEVKNKIRLRIEQNVGDIYTIAADSSNQGALTTLMLAHIYDALDNDTKDRINPQYRGLMEYGLGRYKEADLMVDLKMGESPETGKAFIDEQVDKQIAIFNIIAEELGYVPPTDDGETSS